MLKIGSLNGIGKMLIGNDKVVKAFIGGEKLYEEQSGGIVLPTGYTLLNYVNPNKKARVYLSGLSTPYYVEMSVKLLDLNWYSLFGKNSNNAFSLTNAGKATNGSSTTSSAVYITNQDCIVEGMFSGDSSESSYIVDGVDTGLHRSTTTTDAYIFSADGSTGFPNCEFYYLKIYKDGELIRHYIPCLNDNDTPELYDVVRKVSTSFNKPTDVIYG